MKKIAINFNHSADTVSNISHPSIYIYITLKSLYFCLFIINSSFFGFFFINLFDLKLIYFIFIIDI